MKVAGILLLVAAIALLKVNSSWGQDVVATTAAGIDTAPNAGVPTNAPNLKAPGAAVVPVREQDSPKSTGVIQAKQFGNVPSQGSGYIESYNSVSGECFRNEFRGGVQTLKNGTCGLRTGGIIAILLGILVLALIAVNVVGIFLLKKGKLPQLMPTQRT